MIFGTSNFGTIIKLEVKFLNKNEENYELNHNQHVKVLGKTLPRYSYLIRSKH